MKQLEDNKGIGVSRHVRFPSEREKKGGDRRWNSDIWQGATEGGERFADDRREVN